MQKKLFCLDHGSNNNITNNLINNNPINFADLAHNNTFSISNNLDLMLNNYLQTNNFIELCPCYYI